MSTLSEVTLLIGQRAGDLEKAREIFTAETRSFVTGILAGIRRLRSEPWTTPRVRIDLPREIETEAKATGYLSSQFAISRCNLRFKKGTNYQIVGEIRFGSEYDEPSDAFIWQIRGARRRSQQVPAAGHVERCPPAVAVVSDEIQVVALPPHPRLDVADPAPGIEPGRQRPE
jgi:hypothetical protein